MKTILRISAWLCMPLSVFTTLKADNKVNQHPNPQVVCLSCNGAEEWSSSKAYGNGLYVTYMNRLYRATHYTQGDTPRGFGLYPDGPWLDEGPCY
jgi:hypothetical protein